MIQLGYSLGGDDYHGIGFKTGTSGLTASSQLIVDDGEAHLITIAATGAGKGRSNIIPNCLTYPGSLIVLDPKGEAAIVTQKVRRKYGEVVIIDPFKMVTQTPDKFNPLDTIFDHLPPEQQGVMIAQAFQADYGGIRDDPFWDYKANELLCALCIDEITKTKSFRNLRKKLHADDVDYALALMLDKKEVTNEFALELLTSYLQMPSEKTRPSVLAVAQQHLAILGDPAVMESLEGPTSFDINSLLNGVPMTIYFVIPPNKIRAYAALLRLWITSLLYLLTERKRRPDIPTLLIIDECGNLGKMGALLTALTLLRSYSLRVWCLFQDLGQIKQLYEADWTTILNNCDVIQAFGVNTYLMAKQLVEVIGGITPQQLLSLPADQAIMARPGRPVTRIKKLDYLTDFQFQTFNYSANSMYATSNMSGEKG